MDERNFAATSDEHCSTVQSYETLVSATIKMQRSTEHILPATANRVHQVLQSMHQGHLAAVLESITWAKCLLTMSAASSNAVEALCCTKHVVVLMSKYRTDHWIVASAFAAWSKRVIPAEVLCMPMLMVMADASERNCRDLLTWRVQCDVALDKIDIRDQFLLMLHESVALAMSNLQVDVSPTQTRVAALYYLQDSVATTPHADFVSRIMHSHRATVSKILPITFLSNCQCTGRKRKARGVQREHRVLPVQNQTVVGAKQWPDLRHSQFGWPSNGATGNQCKSLLEFSGQFLPVNRQAVHSTISFASISASLT